MLIGYTAATLGFLVLTLLLATAWRGRREGGGLLAASSASALWAAVAAYHASELYPSSLFVVAAELLRNVLWLWFLLAVLGHGRAASARRFLRMAAAVVVVFGLLMALVLGLIFSGLVDVSPHLGFGLRIFVFLVFSLLGLVLVEQLFRNTPLAERWAIKYLCLGLGGLFAFDFYLYSNAFLLREISPAIWTARGYINAIVVPLIIVSAARNPQWSLDVFVSRSFVFHSASLLGAGIYLLAMAAGGYYIQLYGGEWGGLAQTVFFFAAGMLLVVLLFSGQMRARLRVFLSKHFFNYRYDYREEWLRFIDTLSSARLDPELRGKVIEAMGQIVESPGGLLWQRDEQDDFQLTAYWNMSESRQIVHGNDPLIRFLRKRGWVIELMQVAAEPESYEGLELPAWLEELTEAWLLVPLTNLGELQGFVVLGNPRVPLQINWEVRDLLLTIGRQSASYLALQAANEALVDARQFEAFNRLSAYVVHDLKNLVAQLSLVVRNAERHRDNPAFVEDAFATVDNAVKKMNRLLSQLCQGRMSGQPRRPVEVCALLEEVVAFHARQRPRPVLESCQGPVKVLADGDRLAAVLGHLVQNAQDATPDDGNIQVRLHRQGDKATVEIEDTGCGMDETFVRERLFRPFDTTKGNAGMGIGVYESREFVQSLGGRLTVDSVPGRGTTFRLKLPLVDVADWE